MDDTAAQHRSIDSRQGWIVVAAVTLGLTFTAGVRLLPGIVLKQVTTEFHWSRSDLLLATTINMIFLSVLQPVMGLATDRIGSKKVFVAGTAMLGLMMIPLSRATQLWNFYIFY